MIDLKKYSKRLKGIETIRSKGIVKKVSGLITESLGPVVSIGEVCHIRKKGPLNAIEMEVVGFNDNIVMTMPIGDTAGIRAGDYLSSTGRFASIGVCDNLLGRVIDSVGNPLDLKDSIDYDKLLPIKKDPPGPLQRKRITEVLATGIRSIDGFITVGRGQRIGIFAGSGVGKSTLLGMIAKNTSADINVIALIGERGREVREFIERDLGKDGLERSTVIVATGEQPALMKVRAAYSATAIAEYFKDRGKNVLLMMDSVTRFAMALREIGLSVGEPPSSRGYTPSVFSTLPKLLERPGNFISGGSITGIYTVLVEGDDFDEPVSDAVRSILDGHIMLDRDLAALNHYPPVNVLSSISRLASEVCDADHKNAANILRSNMAVYKEAQDLIQVGAYVKGSSSDIDRAISMKPVIDGFLRQGVDERTEYSETVKTLKEILKK